MGNWFSRWFGRSAAAPAVPSPDPWSSLRVTMMIVARGYGGRAALLTTIRSSNFESNQIYALTVTCATLRDYVKRGSDYELPAGAVREALEMFLGAIDALCKRSLSRSVSAATPAELLRLLSSCEDAASRVFAAIGPDPSAPRR